MHNKTVHLVAFLLIIVGALNWLLVGALELNLVAMLLGSVPMLERAVYVVVGLAAVYELVTHRAHCSHCSVRGQGVGAGQPTPQM